MDELPLLPKHYTTASKKNNKDEIISFRLHKVYKSNSLILNTIHNLSVIEHRLLSYIISKIEHYDEDSKELKPINFELSDYIKTCNIDINSGKNYKNLKLALDKLASTKTYIVEENEKNLSEAFFYWFTDYALITDKETKRTSATITFNPKLKPYLLQFKGKFTNYELINILAMRSGYSLKLYEILKSHAYLGKLRYEVEKFKSTMECTNYKHFGQLRLRVLEPAINEINKFTDLACTFEPEKSGNKVSAILFNINKKDITEVLKTYEIVSLLLDEKHS